MRGCNLESMGKLISVVGASGVGKTALVHALAKAYPPALSKVEGFETAYEEHAERPFQALFKNDARYALANQIDYLLLRVLTDPEFDLCRRVYHFIRELLPHPELIIRLYADKGTVANHLSTRDRINIASAEDTALFNSFLDEWLASIPSDRILELDVSDETLEYERSAYIVLVIISGMSY